MAPTVCQRFTVHYAKKRYVAGIAKNTDFLSCERPLLAPTHPRFPPLGKYAKLLGLPGSTRQDIYLAP